MVNEAAMPRMVVLAQLAEHRIVVPSVVGSSPTFHPNIEKSASYAEKIEKSIKKRSNEFPYFDTIFLRYINRHSIRPYFISSP